MGRKAKPAQKTCPACQTTFTRQRFSGRLEDYTRFTSRTHCSVECMAKAMVQPDPTRDAYRKRVRHKRGPRCNKCGMQSNLQIHHRNRDWRDNRDENLETLCATCHMKDHWAAGDIRPQQSRSGQSQTETTDLDR